MNKSLIFDLISFFIILFGCSPSTKDNIMENNTGIQNVVFEVKQANYFPVESGIGFNWFDHLGTGGYYARWIKYPLSEKIYPEMNDEKGWESIEKGLNELNPGWIRFGLPPDAHIDKKGKLITGTIHLQHLKWLNDWAVKHNKLILLDFFLIPEYYEFNPPEGTINPGEKIVNMAAENNKLYAENFVLPLLNYIVGELKLDAVRYFNPVNEPMLYGVYQTPGNKPDVMIHYVDMYREIRKALDNSGIDRKRMGLVGLDGGPLLPFVLTQHALGTDLDPYIDAYSVHHYDLRFDYLPAITTPDCGKGYFTKGMNVSLEGDDRLFLKYARSRNKPLWALEMGTFYYGKFSNPDGVCSLEATLTVAEGIIRSLNMGVTSFCIWALMNPNNIDGHWAVMSVKNGDLVKHDYPYAVYGLLCNSIEPGSQVFPLFLQNDDEINHLFGVALETPSNQKKFVLVNDDPVKPADCIIKLPSSWENDLSFEISIVDRNNLNQKKEIIKSKNGELRFSCPSFALIGLMEKE